MTRVIPAIAQQARAGDGLQPRLTLAFGVQSRGASLEVA